MQISIWQDTCKSIKFPKIESDIKTDVLIIGGGMSGILCAYFLKQKNVEYILCEAKNIGSGTTAYTTAVLSAQHDILYSELIKKHGEEYAKLYLEANLNAISNFKKIANDIPCDFEICPSYQYSAKSDKQLRNEITALEKLGFNAKLTKGMPLPIKSKTNLCFPIGAQFHPLKFIYGISKDLNIYENSKIDKIEGVTAFCGNNKIFAKRIIVCSHFPILNTRGLYFTKLYQKKSYVLALENAGKYHGTFVDKENGFYFRNYKNLLLAGGGDHRSGHVKDGFKTVRDFVSKNFPNATEKYAWSTQDCMSLDNVAYIGKYSKNTPNIYVATGFNEWGMTTSMISAEILCDMICGKSNKYEKVFNPSRNIFKPQLFANLGETVINFANPLPKRCTHLGCALKWNKYEHTWDCACHGSRFSENGEIINNPSTKELK
jgi:glycine/D-amino acid oxidase-like deaminating enzyme